MMKHALATSTFALLVGCTPPEQQEPPQPDHALVTEHAPSRAVGEPDAGAGDVALPPPLPRPPGDGGADGTRDCRGNPDCERIVFVTAESFIANDLGGLEGADRRCMTAATGEHAHPLLRGRRFLAWLSDAEHSPSSRMVHASAPYRKIDGAPVARSWSDLISGTLENPINIDETGAVSRNGVAWTGTLADGRASASCASWTSGSAELTAIVGRIANTDGQWTSSVGYPCSGPASLYCIEQ